MSNHVQFRIRVHKSEDLAIGPGKVALLEAIDQTGSISAAARLHAMSYRRAWMLVDEMNHSFEEPVIVTATGGKAGGGAALTELGHTVVKLYREAEEKALQASGRSLASLQKLLRDP